MTWLCKQTGGSVEDPWWSASHRCWTTFVSVERLSFGSIAASTVVASDGGSWLSLATRTAPWINQGARSQHPLSRPVDL